MNEKATDAAVIYRLGATDPAGHIFTLSCRIADPDPEGQEIYWPAWIPGSYLIREYARHVMSLEASGAGGQLAVHKLDKATWRIEPTTGPLLITAEIYAHDLSVRGAFLDSGHAFINGVCTFPAVRRHEADRCVLHLEAPAGLPGPDWSVATSLTRLTGAAGHFGAFSAQGYDELVDRPVLLGPLVQANFEVAGVPHRLNFVGAPDIDLERISEDVATICSSHADLFGTPLPLAAYDFLVTVLPKGYGGLEHSESSALVCSRGDLPIPGETGVTAGYRKFLGLVSHEYFHLWNVKRLRPAEFAPYDLQRENYTRQLWLFEGITSYYDDLALLRSGLISADSYLDMVGKSFTRVYRSGGRRRQTLEEASFDAWIKFYRPDENAPNALVSYYTKGAMVALALDLELRLRTDGRVSLDTVMQALWQEYGAAKGLPDGAFERVAEAVSGLRLDEFFQQALRTTVDPPVGILLAQFGVRLQLRPAQSPEDLGGKLKGPDEQPPAWLGIGTRQEAERLMVAHVNLGGPGHKAGLSAGDQLVALNQERLDQARLTASLRRLALDREAQLHVFRRDELQELSIRPARPPRDTASLSLDDTADPDTLARRVAWLGE
jgi:predicted metalloprotease with PDZ domain